ncbi:MAG: hypothetical protein CK518_02245, partial [Actinobacteria bacterium]
TIHLQVMDAHPGARPAPTTNFKVELRLTQYLDKSGAISVDGVTLLHEAITNSINHAHEFNTLDFELWNQIIMQAFVGTGH